MIICMKTKSKHMTLEEYVASFGWKIEDCTPEELKEAKEELKIINQGKVILDGVLAFKLSSSK